MKYVKIQNTLTQTTELFLKRIDPYLWFMKRDRHGTDILLAATVALGELLNRGKHFHHFLLDDEIMMDGCGPIGWIIDVQGRMVMTGRLEELRYYHSLYATSTRSNLHDEVDLEFLSMTGNARMTQKDCHL